MHSIGAFSFLWKKYSNTKYLFYFLCTLLLQSVEICV
jgi:hypothetical protein